MFTALDLRWHLRQTIKVIATRAAAMMPAATVPPFGEPVFVGWEGPVAPGLAGVREDPSMELDVLGETSASMRLWNTWALAEYISTDVVEKECGRI